MALEERTIPHEVLIRFGRGGALQGAHVLEADQVLRDGVIISDVISEARPLALASVKFDEVISEALRQACGRGDALAAELKATKDAADLAALESREALDVSAQEVAFLKAELDRALRELGKAVQVTQTLQALIEPAP